MVVIFILLQFVLGLLLFWLDYSLRPTGGRYRLAIYYAYAKVKNFWHLLGLI